jgi:hypothetical protein
MTHDRHLPSPPLAAACARRDLFTSARIGALGAIVYGTWAMIANLSHGLHRGLSAAGVQAVMSFSVTFCMTEGIHALERRLGTSSGARVVTALLPSLAAAGAMASAHLLCHTPEILRTITPGFVIGTAYSILYVARRATRSPSAI